MSQEIISVEEAQSISKIINNLSQKDISKSQDIEFFDFLLGISANVKNGLLPYIMSYFEGVNSLEQFRNQLVDQPDTTDNPYEKSDFSGTFFDAISEFHEQKIQVLLPDHDNQ